MNSAGIQSFNALGIGLTDPLDQLLRILSDGQARSLVVLSGLLEQDGDAVQRMLLALESGGLRLLRDARGVHCQPFLPLDANSIEAMLLTAHQNADVFVLSLTDSTNSQLLAAFRTGVMTADMTVLASELQQAGRGRLGRVWHATPGASLAVSFAIRIDLAATAMSGFSLVCGLAARDALLRHGVEAMLKWPNDLLSGSGKLGGILVESQRIDDALGVVIGIGLNVASDSERSHALAEREAALPASDMCAAGARHPVDRNRLVADLAECLGEHVAQFKQHGFTPFVAAWNRAHAFQDETISLIEEGRVVVSGKALGVDAEGRLEVATADGLRTLVAGDISVRRST